MRYIDLNPVLASMTQHPADYRWSNYAFYAEGKSSMNSNWLTAHEEYLRLGLSDAEDKRLIDTCLKRI